MNPFLSFIIPVYNRPQEISELLASFKGQTFTGDYEIVIVEDGSSITAQPVIKKFKDLPVIYFFKENSGPGASRNFGMQRAKGDYFIILDSDCILPVNYIDAVNKSLLSKKADFFGGPDAAATGFTPIQQAINFSMTSFFTTGGIRGHKNGDDNFQPRSFNMGISKKAFEASGGFGDIHPGEDPDLTLRLWKLGYKSAYFHDAFVYHKRRISWRSFYSQVRKFGLVRPILNSWHPGSQKLTYWFPTVFTIYALAALVLLFFDIYLPILFLGAYFLVLAIQASVIAKSLIVGILAVFASCIQFVGYGLGFLEATIAVGWLKMLPRKRYPNLFFD